MLLDEEKVDVKRCISDLYILLNDESCSLLQQALDRDYSEAYVSCGDVVEQFECMVDEITRLWRLVYFHDALASVDSDLLQAVVDKDFEYMSFSRFSDEDLILIMEKCNNQLIINGELYGLDKEVRDRWRGLKNDKED